jgi:hypothetical protein
VVVVKGKLHAARGGLWPRLEVLGDVAELVQAPALPSRRLGLKLIDVSVTGIRDHVTVDPLVGDAASLLFH